MAQEVGTPMQEPRYYPVPLFRRDGSVRDIAVVDYADALQVGVYRWHRTSSGYAVRYLPGNRPVLMHRQVLGLVSGDGVEVDHINRDKLDNRRCNLRVGDHAANARNTPAAHNSTSRHRGVQWVRGRKRWRVRVKYLGQAHHLGYFDDEDEAGAVAQAFLEKHGML